MNRTIFPTPLTACVACKDGSCLECGGRGYYEVHPFPPYGIRTVPCECGDGKCPVCRGDVFTETAIELPPLPTDEPLHDVSPLDVLGCDAQMNLHMDFPALWHQTHR